MMILGNMFTLLFLLDALDLLAAHGPVPGARILRPIQGRVSPRGKCMRSRENVYVPHVGYASKSVASSEAFHVVAR